VTPTFARRLLGAAASTVDRAFVAAMDRRNAPVHRPSESLSHHARLARLAEIQAEYGAAPADAYFAVPGAARPALRRVREGVFDATWPSAYEPFLPALRDAYLAHAENRTAHARLFLAKEPRPVALLIHGYLAGQWAVEERAWPVGWFRRIGLDVAIPLLPFHALRGRPDGRAPPFPGADPRFTNEGFRQAVHDLRALIGFLRARGAPEVGVMGMSLGGYTTALLATVEDDLGFAVPIIPLASIADFARDHGRLGRGAETPAQHRALEAANRVVSPLSRPSRVAKERVLVVAADADRITPASHAERLARHFDAPLVRMHGGHLLQFGRGDAFRAIARMLGRIGTLR
jgi:pimeloyl-ACP methyl ester carboxylesterase